MRPGFALAWLASAALLAGVPITPDTTAWAQLEAWPCPAGPGPGEVVVGQGVQGVPMCRGGQGGAPALLPSRFNAVAWHPDYDDFWAVGGYLSRNAAADAAVALCDQDTGGGCTYAFGAENGAVAVARGWDSALWIDDGPDGGSAKRKALRRCNPNNLLPCEVIGTHGSKSGTRRPKNLVLARRVFGAMAWPRSNGDRRMFLATGHANPDDAASAALDLCTRNSPTGDCSVQMNFTSGYVQAFRSQAAATGELINRAISEVSAKRAEQAAQALCKELKEKCFLQGNYDVRSRGLFVLDFEAPLPAAPKK